MALTLPSDMSEELHFGKLLVGVNTDEVLQQFDTLATTMHVIGYNV